MPCPEIKNKASDCCAGAISQGGNKHPHWKGSNKAASIQRLHDCLQKKMPKNL